MQWINGSMSHGSVGQMGHNCGWVTWVMGHSMLTHYHSQHMSSFYGSAQKRVLVIPASSAECERHFTAFNARNIITAQRNGVFPETVQAVSIIHEGYKNKRLK